MAISWYAHEHGEAQNFMWGGTVSFLLQTHITLLFLAAITALVTTPIHRNQMVFTTYYLLLSIAILIRVFVTMSFLDPASNLYSASIELAVINLEHHYKLLTNSEFVSSVNTFMINARCCGLNGPNDFLHTPLHFKKENFLFPYNPYKGADVYFPPGNVTYSFKIPPVCCKPYLFNEGSEDHAFKAIAECARGDDESVINWTGCLQRLQELVLDHEAFILIVFAVMFSIEAMSLTMAVYLALQEKKRYQDMKRAQSKKRKTKRNKDDSF